MAGWLRPPLRKETPTRILLGLFLLGHALIHTGYLSPAPSTAGGLQWPFEMNRSWVVTTVGMSPDVLRVVGASLVVVVVIAMLGAALATFGLVVPQSWWRPLVLAGAAGSVLTLILFFHPWIMLGLLIDVFLLYLVLVAGWDPFATVAGAL